MFVVGGIEIKTMADLERERVQWNNAKRENPVWGDWRFLPRSLELELRRNGREIYSIDLERMSDSAGILDWIFQVRGKNADWRQEGRNDPRDVSDKDLADLLDALCWLIDPQANLCSCGENRTIDDMRALIEHKMAFEPEKE